MTLCGVAFIVLFNRQFLHALVGGAFDRALPLLVPYGTAMVLLSVTNLLASYGIATHRLTFSVPLLTGTLATLAAIVYAHPSLQTVTYEMLAGNAITCALVACALFVPLSKKRERAG
jgi:hypothetical protein